MVTYFEYLDECRKPLYRAVREDFANGDKDFSQERADGRGGWIAGVSGVKRVPYRLPELLESDQWVFLVEGEKCVDALNRWGLCASTNSGGSSASSVYSEWGEFFKDRDVFILPDNDGPGRKHAVAVAEALMPVAGTVNLVYLPDLPESGDIADWIAAGGTREQFGEIAKESATLDSNSLNALKAKWGISSQQKAGPKLRSEKAESHARTWPVRLTEDAFYGVMGEIVKAIEPHTESDSAAILIQLLVGLGSVVGRHFHFRAEADRHFCNLFAVLVGETAKGRKGTSWGHVRDIIKRLDPTLTEISGCGSGEGLIWAVRDPIEKSEPIKHNGKITDYQIVRTDEGVADKRLLVVEPEFARLLQVAERESSTLSAVVRLAWDTGCLRIVTKNSPAVATDSHISIVGHITKDELQRELSDTATANGFANRFLWVCVKRSKLLPEGGNFILDTISEQLGRLESALRFANRIVELKRDGEARMIWRNVYPDLSEGRAGLLGAVTSRAEAQSMRIAVVYAILDCSEVVRACHLKAALAVWRYCEDSAKFIFGDAMGDAVADEISKALRKKPEGMTREAIREYFSRNKSASELSRALEALEKGGLARSSEEQTGGRPAIRWHAVNA